MHHKISKPVKTKKLIVCAILREYTHKKVHSTYMPIKKIHCNLSGCQRTDTFLEPGKTCSKPFLIMMYDKFLKPPSASLQQLTTDSKQ